MIYCVGVDCSTKGYHAIVLNHEGFFVGGNTFVSISENDVQRMCEIADAFRTDLYVFDHHVNDPARDIIIVTEGPIYVQNVKVTLKIARSVFGIQTTGWPEQHFTIDNKAWKKDILGNGNATKDDIKQFAMAKWAQKLDKQDFCDAACIALWGVRRFG